MATLGRGTRRASDCFYSPSLGPAVTFKFKQGTRKYAQLSSPRKYVIPAYQGPISVQDSVSSCKVVRQVVRCWLLVFYSLLFAFFLGGRQPAPT